jgi:uncharacterized protein (TIGR02147 family)
MHSSFLKDIYLERKRKNPRYSLSALARDLGLSVSFVSRLVHGQRPLTPALAAQLGPILKLSPKTTQSLIESTVQSRSKTKKLAQKLAKAQEQDQASQPKFLEVEQFRVVSEWYHLAILSLARLKDFESNPKWIAKRLGISLVQAKDAIERLQQLGLLVNSSGRLIPAQNGVFFQTKTSTRAIREYQFAMIEKARQELQKTDQTSFEQRYIAGSAIALPSSQLETFKKRLKEFQVEFARLAENEPADSVYHLNLQFFPLTQSSLKEKKS